LVIISIYLINKSNFTNDFGLKDIVILEFYSPGKFWIYTGRDHASHFLNYDRYFDSRMSSSDSETEDFSSDDDDSFVIADHKEDFGDSEVENRVPNPVSI